LSFFDGKFGILTVIKEICPRRVPLPLRVWNRNRAVALAGAERIYLNCRKCAPVEGKWAMTRDNGAHSRVYTARSGKRKYLRTGEMQSYLSMVARCSCRTNNAYENYGGRGSASANDGRLVAMAGDLRTSFVSAGWPQAMSLTFRLDQAIR
jgi:hypothetical protein